MNPTQSRNHASLRDKCGPALLGALEAKDTIEVMLNPDGRLWVEKFGQPRMLEIGTMAAAQAMTLVRQLAGLLGKVVTEEHPQLDGSWPLDGSRVSVAIPPIVKAPVIAFRRLASKVFPLAEYVSMGTLDSGQYAFLREAIAGHRNILVVGGTSSGKTTFANGLLHEISLQCPDERLILIEDTGELKSSSSNVVFFKTSETVTVTSIIKQCLRLNPHRIFVGELRDGSALDLMDAWNTGHPGGVATLHANSAQQGLGRLRSLISRNSAAPREIDEVIGEAVQVIVYMEKTPHGRKVKEILEVKGYNRPMGEYELHEVGTDLPEPIFVSGTINPYRLPQCSDPIREKLENYCIQCDQGRGIYKVIDENRENLICLLENAPDFLERHIWVPSWFGRTDRFLVDLVHLLGWQVHSPLRDDGAFPRPWPDSRYWERSTQESSYLVNRDADDLHKNGL